LLFMAPLAGAGLAACIERMGALLPAPRLFRAAKATVVIILLLCSPVFALFASRGQSAHTVSTTMTAEVADLVEALKLHTNTAGRLMVEDGPAWAYGDSHFPSLIPLYTGVQQIGGPYAFAFIKHNFTTFQARRTMGAPLKDLKPERFAEYLDLYNVHWILTATPECAAYVNALLYARSVWSSKHFGLWEVSTGSTFASAPGVKVDASYDMIHVSIPAGAGPPPKNVLLKFHWDRGLTLAPPARIEPEMRLDDPVPLILLEPNGATDIRIRFH
jgi:hypothetical protein